MNTSPQITKMDIQDSPPGDQKTLGRVFRLVVGVALVGQDLLRQQIPIWEAEVARRLVEPPKPPAPSPASAGAAGTPPAASRVTKKWEYKLVGLVFETPNYIKSGFTTLWHTEQKIWQKTAPLRYPLDWLGISDMTQRTVDRIARRIQADSERLEQIGEAEAGPSRALASVAIADIYQKVLDLLAQSPEIRGLIAQQSAGVTTEVIREVRERTVSADSLADNLTRRIFRKTPKTEPDEFTPKKPETSRDPNW